MSENVASLFQRELYQWFVQRVGQPTAAQQSAWPEIARGSHVLVTAPTGSGKTFTAFLWGLQNLVSGKWSASQTSMLYVSPLKALNNDIQRNLLTPLAQLSEHFQAKGLAFPQISVLTRSGDTPQLERRRMLRNPPSILITTPESLHIMLTSNYASHFFTHLKTVILDEIHAVASHYRGVLLMSAVERLTLYAGEFQRVALSATVRPLDRIASFVGGYQLHGATTSPRYEKREVRIIAPKMEKTYDLSLKYAIALSGEERQKDTWKEIVEHMQQRIEHNRSTLIFTNSRRLTEKLTLKINNLFRENVAYAHHGSLSKELRFEVEQKLKAGELRAIVATSSLELGIDIGDIDEVLLVQTPPLLSSALQRVGRSGHQIGAVSRGIYLPTHNQDLLLSTVQMQAVREGEIEASKPLQNPLDVLAQLVISMVVRREWHVDELFAFVRQIDSFHTLSREHFELVLQMLTGRYASTRIRELHARIYLDSETKMVKALKGASHAVFLSGGVIPDRGYFKLRHAVTNAMIGELDEEFVWEARVGQVFTLGTQKWKIDRITHDDVFVVPGPQTALATPFWRAEKHHRSFHFSQYIGRFLELADGFLAQKQDDKLIDYLKHTVQLDEPASLALKKYLKEQRSHTGVGLPHRHHLLIEFVQQGPGSTKGNQIYLHTLWGGRVNHPYALCLESAWIAKFGVRPEIFWTDDCLLIVLPPSSLTASEIMGLVTPYTMPAQLKESLTSSGFFGARFREAAGRALLVSRRTFKKRFPLWMSRLRAQQLMERVSAYRDFPLTIEAWRTCLQDEFEIDTLRELLEEVLTGVIKVSVVATSKASPLARETTWSQINEYMYRNDKPRGRSSLSVTSDIIDTLIYSDMEKPGIDAAVIADFVAKRQRLAEGYSPDNEVDLRHWMYERVFLTNDEWETLKTAILRDHGESLVSLLESEEANVVRHTLGKDSPEIVTSKKRWRELQKSLFQQVKNAAEPTSSKHAKKNILLSEKMIPRHEHSTPASQTILSEWLSFHGPFTLQWAARCLGIDEDVTRKLLEPLLTSRQLIVGRLIKDDDTQYFCDSTNYDILLRMARRAAKSTFEPRELEELIPFMATLHGIIGSGDKSMPLIDVLDKLLFLPQRAALWEQDFFPARVQNYHPDLLDKAFHGSDLSWVGVKRGYILFLYLTDHDLLHNEAKHGSQQIERKQPKGESTHNGPQSPTGLKELFSDSAAKYPFQSLADRFDGDEQSLGEFLWEQVWHGLVTNDSYEVVRRGIKRSFEPRVISDESKRGIPSMSRRARLRRQHSGLRKISDVGNWFILPDNSSTTSLLEYEEANKERVRILLDRYGVLCRELLIHEHPSFQWRELFNTMRLMELSGELIAGLFFYHLSAPQFISPQAMQELRRFNAAADDIFWLNACDPVSPCGKPAFRDQPLPRRVPGNYLVYHGPKHVVSVENNGRSVTFNCSSQSPHLERYFIIFDHLLQRHVNPLIKIVIDTINGAPAAQSPYRDRLRKCFSMTEHFESVVLRTKY